MRPNVLDIAQRKQWCAFQKSTQGSPVKVQGFSWTIQQINLVLPPFSLPSLFLTKYKTQSPGVPVHSPSSSLIPIGYAYVSKVACWVPRSCKATCCILHTAFYKSNSSTQNVSGKFLPDLLQICNSLRCKSLSWYSV